MKKLSSKPLKLQIKPVFQFSAGDKGSSAADMLLSDPITIPTVTMTKVFGSPAVR